MKPNSKIVAMILGTIAICLISTSFKLDETHDTIMIRSTLAAGLRNGDCVMRVYKGNQQIEKMALEKWSWNKEDTNFDVIMTKVNNFEKTGYKVISHNETYTSVDNVLISTFILVKK